MSLIVSAVLPKCALIMSDSRGCVEENGRYTTVSDTVPKVLPLPRGGFMQSGPGFKWGRDLHSVLAKTDGTLPAVVKAVQEQAPAAMHEYEATHPDMARFIHNTQSTIIIGSDPERGLFFAELDWRGTVLVYGGPSRTFLGVPDSLRDTALTLHDTLDDTLGPIARASPSLDRATMAGIINHTAAFCHDVYERCGPQGEISPYCEAGLIVQTASGAFMSLYLPRTLAQTVLSTVDPHELLTAPPSFH